MLKKDKLIKNYELAMLKSQSYIPGMRSCYFQEYNPKRNFRKFQKGVITHDSLEK